MTEKELTVKIHVTEGKRILAVCDTCLLGKVFESDTMVLDLSSEFYAGKSIASSELKNMLRTAYIVNLAGEISLQTVKEAGLVDSENVIEVEGIPHAQVLIIHSE